MRPLQAILRPLEYLSSELNLLIGTDSAFVAFPSPAPRFSTFTSDSITPADCLLAVESTADDSTSTLGSFFVSFSCRATKDALLLDVAACSTSKGEGKAKGDG